MAKSARDPELVALGRIVRLIDALELDQRERVVDYLRERYPGTRD